MGPFVLESLFSVNILLSVFLCYKMATKLIELPMYVKQEVLRIAQTMGLTNPKWGATRGSKNGENYSGDVYRVIAVPEDGTIPEDPALNRFVVV